MFTIDDNPIIDYVDKNALNYVLDFIKTIKMLVYFMDLIMMFKIIKKNYTRK